MPKGVIKTYKPDKSFGFITVEGESGDVFFHKDDMLKLGVSENQIKEGHTLEVAVYTNDKGQKRVSTKFKTNNPVERPRGGNAPSVKKIPQQLNENFALRLNKVPLYTANFDILKLDGKNGKIDIPLVKNLAEQEKGLAHQLLQESNCSTIVTTSTDRLAIGLGSASVYETNINLHHIYGIPFIPASSIKGIVRSWAIEELNTNNIPENEQKEPLINAESRALQNNADFCKIFGCPSDTQEVLFDDDGKPQKKEKNKFKTKSKPVALRNQWDKTKGQEHQGNVIFFDAYPTAKSVIVEPDIMNPHYSEYYDGKTPPADYLNPVPIIFLTVARGTSFQFVIGIKNAEHKLLLEKTKKWLEEALENKGIGAKTAIGYGFMTI
jgi:CRISPR type III-B/RAMP module RAMP protein Cmr6